MIGRSWFIISLTLILYIITMFSAQTIDMGMVNAATNNSTMSDFPVKDQFQDEIKPAVNSFREGATLQADTVPPNIIFTFIGASEDNKFKVSADENWYLKFDINTPGWLYIYEYLPPESISQGRWIAYKWELPQSGIWKLGPFVAGKDEPAGQHAYKAWFYSDGQWVGADSKLAENNLIYWTYIKGASANVTSAQKPLAQTTNPVNKPTFANQLKGFFTNPFLIVLGPAFLIGICGFLLTWRYRRRDKNEHVEFSPVDTVTEKQSTVLSSPVLNAKILLPHNIEIELNGNNLIMGRGDFARILNLDELGLISRHHFEIKALSGQFYIEDLDSTNGTLLNGKDIKGKGQAILHDSDVIEIPGSICLKFCIP